ncbi:MAG TPA: DUF4129 domain-containing protein [Gemmatimonadaceae bacterium]|nr:DUF4129 domain-containing protein [Gemmatimonadaceae bacterium]
MILLPPQAVAGPWTAKQIHDTVAAIVRQRAYSVPVRQSILGRILLAVFRWIRDLLEQIKAWPDARYLLIAAVVVVVLAVAGRIVIAQQIEARRRVGVGLRAIGGERRDYWAMAAEMDAAGDFVGACHAVYIGVLDALTRMGAVRYHASKTSGDYARDLRQRQSPVAGDFWSFARQFDRSVFGWTAPTHEDYVRLARAAEGIVPRRAAA